jgi:hypothetical protein
MTAAHPQAVCTLCGHFVWSGFQIDQQCGERYNGARCGGTNSSASHFTFSECPACHGTGNKCLRCSGNRIISREIPVE